MKRKLAMPLALGICLAAHASAQPRVWTHAGSSGTVDETSLSVVRLVQGEATLTPGAPNSTRAVIRYNVVAVEGLFAPLAPASWPALGIRYRDNGVAAQVLATLKAYDYTTGITSTIVTFDSNQYAQSVAYQTRAIGDCANFQQFDFTKKAYFVEVDLVRTAAGGDPGVGVLLLSRYGVCLWR